MLNRMDGLVGSYGFFGADNRISYDDTAELAGGDFAEVVLAKGFPLKSSVLCILCWVSNPDLSVTKGPGTDHTLHSVDLTTLTIHNSTYLTVRFNGWY